MTVDGFEITVTRKNVKNINLRIKPPDGRIEVSCPRRVTNEQLAAFIREKSGWIRAHREKILSASTAPEKQYLTGETIPVWGINYPLTVLTGAPAVQVTESGVILTVPENSTADDRKACIDFWYRENLSLAVGKRMPYWEAKTGLKCSRVSIRDMKTRWGSCTHATAAIRVNLRLAEKPPECLDYLILHELTHIRHPNHSRAFYADIEKHMPDWKERHRILNGRDEDE
ncbi:MAG: M48 family metallopeptidase [Clostridia bacterium]|nr:M48 family metallopeptidase [Clostridia bacterium]